MYNVQIEMLMGKKAWLKHNAVRSSWRSRHWPGRREICLLRSYYRQSCPGGNVHRRTSHDHIRANLLLTDTNQYHKCLGGSLSLWNLFISTMGECILRKPGFPLKVLCLSQGSCIVNQSAYLMWAFFMRRCFCPEENAFSWEISQERGICLCCKGNASYCDLQFGCFLFSDTLYSGISPAPASGPPISLKQLTLQLLQIASPAVDQRSIL